MKFKFLNTSLVGFLLIVSGFSNAGLILLHQPGTSTTTFSFDNEGRQTLIEVLNPLLITQLGAEIDPLNSNVLFDWRVYNSDGFGSVGSVVTALKDITFSDIGMSVYDTSVSFVLSSGFYLLELYAQEPETSNSTLMARYNEFNQGLSFITTDLNFRVIDGASTESASALTKGTVILSNIILPSFSITATAIRVPSPTTFSILILGLAVVGWSRRKKV